MKAKVKQHEVIFGGVRDRIIAELEACQNDKWRKPWRELGLCDGTVPHNASTGTVYRGMNILNLAFAVNPSTGEAFESNGWVTFKQAKEIDSEAVIPGGKVNNYVVFFSTFTKKDRVTKEPVLDANGKKKEIRFWKAYPVWNVEQIEWTDSSKLKVFEPAEQKAGVAAAVVDALGGGATVYGGDRCFYRAATDTCYMVPEDQFESREAFEASELHEGGHKTGHKSRLDRQFGKRFGDEAYAFEELVAELTAAMTGAVLGIPYEGLQHTQYIASWLKVLKSDEKAIITAASQASKAGQFMIEAYAASQQEEAA